MKLNSYREDDFQVIELSGDLDASSCIVLDEALSKAMKTEKKILIDCGNLNYISSAGLGVFMSYLQEFEVQKISLVLFNLNQKVRKVFQILGLDELMQIVSSKQEAKMIPNESKS